jgi:hypothetical protein
MTDFDYGLVNHAIRITSDRSDCVCLWIESQRGCADRIGVPVKFIHIAQILNGAAE